MYNYSYFYETEEQYEDRKNLAAMEAEARQEAFEQEHEAG